MEKTDLWGQVSVPENHDPEKKISVTSVDLLVNHMATLVSSLRQIIVSLLGCVFWVQLYFLHTKKPASSPIAVALAAALGTQGFVHICLGVTHLVDAAAMSLSTDILRRRACGKEGVLAFVRGRKTLEATMVHQSALEKGRDVLRWLTVGLSIAYGVS